jgi:hypothetical protein
MSEQLSLPGLVADEPLPERVERYIHTIYGPPGGDRADWARRAARLLLAGWEPAESLPRASHRIAADRLAGLRRVVASEPNRTGAAAGGLTHPEPSDGGNHDER